ncbi:hypothetical protein SDC9_82455 [bioreactor metagenome]|uniref:Uncharacterized protein n=1 Tax=bioreactor metagenome TaxID=1076179 RepID=A0A644Z772_9ZZZZ
MVYDTTVLHHRDDLEMQTKEGMIYQNTEI